MSTPHLFNLTEAVKTLRAKQPYRQNVEVKESPYHNANITLWVQKNGAIKVQAKATKKDYILEKDPEVKRLRTCSSKNQIPLVVGQVASQAARDADAKCKRDSDSPSKDGSLVKALEDILQEYTEDDFPEIRRSYTKGKRYLLNFMAPEIDKIGAEQICKVDLETIFRDRVDAACESRRGKKTKGGEKLPKEKEKVIQGQRTWWRIGERIYRQVQKEHPDKLPVIDFPEIKPVKVHQEEQIKEFLRKIRVKAYYILLELFLEGVVLAGAGLMALLCGLRVAEATGLQVRSVGADGETIFVGGQEKKGVRVDYPKSDDGNRLIPLRDEARAVIARRMAELKKSGILAAHPDGKIPLFSAPNQPLTYYRSERLSDLLRTVLELAGCDEAYLIAAQQEIDFKKAGPARLTAHQLRHDWFSLLMNECGIPQTYVDTIGGHINKEDLRGDRVTADTVRWIQQMQRRFVYDIDLAQDPAYKPVVCMPDVRVDIPDGSAIMLEAAEDGVYRINAVSREPYDNLQITAPSGCLQAEAVTMYDVPYRPEDPETSIGWWIAPEELRQWKKEVDEMDLLPLIDKYSRTRTKKTSEGENE